MPFASWDDGRFAWDAASVAWNGQYESRPIPVARHYGRGRVPYGDDLLLEAALRKRERVRAEERARAEAELIVNRNMQLMLDEEDAIMALFLAV